MSSATWNGDEVSNTQTTVSFLLTADQLVGNYSVLEFKQDCVLWTVSTEFPPEVQFMKNLSQD